MESALIQVGVGGIFAVLVLREVFTFLGKRNGKNQKACPTLSPECIKTHERLIGTTKDIAESLRRQGEVLREISQNQAIIAERLRNWTPATGAG